MEFSEIYCNDCKKVLARYNVKYYSEDMIASDYPCYSHSWWTSYKNS